MTRYTQRSLKPYLLGSASAFLMASGAQVAFAEDATETSGDEISLIEQAQVQSAQAASQQDQEDALVPEAGLEQIVVTGSRIRRDTFSSTTPTQVLDTEENFKLGVNTVAEMISRSTVSSGQQLDRSINTNSGNSNATESSPDSGQGATNIDLRGLGSERTLVLVNGKRVAGAGVRGAPVQPDIGLIPIGMVEGVDILTGGQSTIYGADAVGGVVNLRLKQDFEGIDVSGSMDLPEAGGGNEFQSSIVAGITGDRGSITVGFEYFRQDRVRGNQRSFTPCLRAMEIAEDGEVFDPCRSPFFDDIVLIADEPLPGFEEGAMPPGVPVGPDGLTGSDAAFFIFTPGQSDTGIPNFSTGFNFPNPSSRDPQNADFPNALDPDAQDARPALQEFGDQKARQNADLVSPIERFSFVTNGHVDLDFGHNEELYFEGYFFDRQNKIQATNEQIFPTIKGEIPQVDENGNIVVDTDPDNDIEDGEPILVDNPLNPFPVAVAPILTLDDFPQNFKIDVQQFRGVLGFRGEVPIDWFSDRNWTYDAFYSYDRSTGFQSQQILFEPNLTLATQTLRMNANGELECGIPLGGDLSGIGGTNQIGFLTPQECVPEAGDFFSRGFRDGEGGSGTFASDAARDFLLGNRTNRTVIQQHNSAVNVTGDMFDIPWGQTAGIAVGAEFRSDQVNSQNSIVGVKGLNAAENPVPEGETAGKRWIYDVYGEVSLPLVTGEKWAEYFEVHGAVRFTEEENFGSEVTWRIGGIWQPVDWLTFNVARNTAFRAPNLREQFLAAQSQGISGGADPCNSNNTINLDPANNPIDARIIENCILSGADPDATGATGTTTIETLVGGTTDLNAEESDSLTLTAQFTQPWFDSFEWDLAVTYYDIDVTNNVNELDAAVILSRCFSDEPDLQSPFCELIQRQGDSRTLDQIGAAGGRDDVGDNQVRIVDASFVNLGLETANGIDITSRFRTDLGVYDSSPLSLSWSVGATYVMDQERQIFEDSPLIDNAGRIGNPELAANTTLTLSWNRFQLLYQGRYIGETAGDEDIVEAFEPFTQKAFLATDKATRPIATADRRFYSDVSVSIDLTGVAPVVFTTGINNLTDQDPPLIARSEGPNRLNAVTSSGFDLLGRSFFANATMRF